MKVRLGGEDNSCRENPHKCYCEFHLNDSAKVNLIHAEMPKGGSDKKRSEINLEDLLCFKGYVVEQTTSKLSQFINLSKAFFFHSTGLVEEKNIYERYFRHYLYTLRKLRGAHRSLVG